MDGQTDGGAETLIEFLCPIWKRFHASSKFADFFYKYETDSAKTNKGAPSLYLMKNDMNQSIFLISFKNLDWIVIQNDFLFWYTEKWKKNYSYTSSIISKS